MSAGAPDLLEAIVAAIRMSAHPAVSALTQSTMTGRSTTTSPTGQGWRGPPAGVIREEIPAGRGRGDGFCP